MQFDIIKAGSYDLDGSDDRVSWPWSKMQVGDKVDIPSNLLTRAQTACHVYGHARGMKFKTRKQTTGELTVTRLK